MRTAPLVIGVGILSIGLAGCGGATKSADTTTIINQTVISSASSVANSAGSSGAATSVAPGTQAQPAADFPQPPAGANVVKTDTENGTARTKYSVTGQDPMQVVEYYTNLWRTDGYTIISSGGGGDPGRGGGASAVASKAGVFIGVDAGAGAGEPTHFDVCRGADERAVRDCID